MKLSRNDYSTSRPSLFFIVSYVSECARESESCSFVFSNYISYVFCVCVHCVHFHPINIHYHSLNTAFSYLFRFPIHSTFGRLMCCVRACVRRCSLLCSVFYFVFRQILERLSTRLQIMYLSQVMRIKRYSHFLLVHYKLLSVNAFKNSSPNQKQKLALRQLFIELRQSKWRDERKQKLFRPNSNRKTTANKRKHKRQIKRTSNVHMAR